MRISDFLVRELGRRQVVLFFLLASSLYVLPLVGYLGYPALVDSLYYRICLLGDYAFIVMKEPPHGRLLQW